jgi:hypothetical protein
MVLEEFARLRGFGRVTGVTGVTAPSTRAYPAVAEMMFIRTQKTSFGFRLKTVLLSWGYTRYTRYIW